MSVAEPRPYRWTRDEYYRLCETGWFQDRRVQLIGGEIIEMPAQTNWHALGIGFTDNTLRAAFGPNFWVRIRMSLDLGPCPFPIPTWLSWPAASAPIERGTTRRRHCWSWR